MSMLEDGTYDVMVVDAQEHADSAIALELVVSSGPLRGEVVRVLATNIGRTWADLLAAPATLIVHNGEPRVTFD